MLNAFGNTPAPAGIDELKLSTLDVKSGVAKEKWEEVLEGNPTMLLDDEINPRELEASEEDEITEKKDDDPDVLNALGIIPAPAELNEGNA